MLSLDLYSKSREVVSLEQDVLFSGIQIRRIVLFLPDYQQITLFPAELVWDNCFYWQIQNGGQFLDFKAVKIHMCNAGFWTLFSALILFIVHWCKAFCWSHLCSLRRFSSKFAGSAHSPHPPPPPDFANMVANWRVVWIKKAFLEVDCINEFDWPACM